LIITVTVVLYRKWNIEKINDKDNNNYNNLLLNENIKNTLGKNNSINIVVNRSSLDLETKLPSYEKNNSISKVDDPLKSKTFVMSNKVSSISSVPSSKSKNNKNIEKNSSDKLFIIYNYILLFYIYLYLYLFIFIFIYIYIKKI